jgi:peptide/nickel transport system permease protein
LATSREGPQFGLPVEEEQGTCRSPAGVMHFWGYVTRRAAWGGVVFVVLCYAFALCIYGYIEISQKDDLRSAAFEMAREVVRSERISEGTAATLQEFSAVYERLYQSMLRTEGLDGPILARVQRLAVKLMTFNFGDSRKFTTMTGQPQERTNRVLPVVAESLVLSVCLFGATYLIQFGLAFLLGLHHAAKRRASRTTMILGVTAQGVSIIVISMLAVLVFAYCLRLHPTDPWVFRTPATYNESLGHWVLDLLHHFWVPFLTLTFGTFWSTAYIVEKLAWDVSAQEYVDAARARGLRERHIKYGHIARSASPALATMAVQGIFLALWGGFIVERVFSLPGIGSLFIMAIQSYDRYVVAGVLVLVTLLFQIGLFLLDVSYGFLDPRIRVGAKASAFG